MKTEINRRFFLKISTLTGGGLAFGLEKITPIFSQSDVESFQPNKFLVFQKDGFIRLFSGRSEMGQGTNTNIKYLAAEELCVHPDKILLEIQSPKEGFFVGTGGSWGTAGYYRSVRPVFATARQVLINAAAKYWEVSPEKCRAENGMVIYLPMKKSIAYEKLLDKTREMEIPESAPLIPKNEYKYLGKPNDLDQLNEMLTGQLKYGIDQYVEGMLYASVERCPVAGGALKNLDTKEAMKIEGVEKIIPIEGTDWEAHNYYPAGVAVLATNSWAAQQGRKALKIEWEKGKNVKLNNDYVQNYFDEKINQEGVVFKSAGDFDKSINEADEIMEQYYETPFWSHSPMEPMNSIAHWQEGKIEIWASCHMQVRLMEAVKKITGFKEDKIKIYTPHLGGSFGRRLLVDYAIEAVLLSKAAKAPVQMLYSRKDETKFGHFMSGGKYLLRSAIKNNRPTALGLRVVHVSAAKQKEPQMVKDGIDSTIASDILRSPYEIKNKKYEHHLADELKIPVSWWRGTFVNTAVFVLESWMDELAAKTKTDPIDFRLSFLKNDAELYIPEKGEQVDKKIFKNVLNAIKGKSDWNKKRKKRHGKGVAACSTFFDSYAAMATEVCFDKNNKLNINKITCAIDCGFALNPSMIKAQIESGVVFALSAMLKSSINFKNGEVVENSYWDYPILTYAECPEIETIILPSDRPASGVGELANAVTFAAVCNAIYDAIGVRVRSLPLDRYFDI